MLYILFGYLPLKRNLCKNLLNEMLFAYKNIYKENSEIL